MVKKYYAPVLMGTPDNPNPSFGANWQSVRDEKEDLSTSFVYGDDYYEEEYVVPDIFAEITPETDDLDSAGAGETAE